jgi:hypothetical protein
MIVVPIQQDRSCAKTDGQPVMKLFAEKTEMRIIQRQKNYEIEEALRASSTASSPGMGLQQNGVAKIRFSLTVNVAGMWSQQPSLAAKVKSSLGTNMSTTLSMFCF